LELWKKRSIHSVYAKWNDKSAQNCRFKKKAGESI
jgi:hypothetical protein